MGRYFGRSSCIFYPVSGGCNQYRSIKFEFVLISSLIQSSWSVRKLQIEENYGIGFDRRCHENSTALSTESVDGSDVRREPTIQPSNRT
jgi:hypothetical protein